jgi:cysteinyl-tRNA synthetase
MDALKRLEAIPSSEASQAETPTDLGQQVRGLIDQMYQNMSDDFNSAKSLASIFELVTIINTLSEQPSERQKIDKSSLNHLKTYLAAFVFEVLGLKADSEQGVEYLDAAMQLLIDIRNQARKNRDFATSDRIRDALMDAGILLKDGKNGTEYELQ